MRESAYTGETSDVTTYFTGKTESYQRHRPGYPASAISAILEGLGPSPVVADIGCGTGISSRALAAGRARVIGIEPNDDMRACAVELGWHKDAHPIEYRAGTAERTGLEDRSVDCIVCAQAFHWFDRDGALREFHRILKPAGKLALVWNKRDERDPCSREYERIIGHAMEMAESAGRVVARFRSAPDLRPLFHQQSLMRHDNPASYTWDDLLGRVRSSSYWPDAGDSREMLEGDLRALFDRHQRADVLHIQQFTELTLATTTP